jgi:hypothetical protein
MDASTLFGRRDGEGMGKAGGRSPSPSHFVWYQGMKR